MSSFRFVRENLEMEAGNRADGRLLRYSVIGVDMDADVQISSRKFFAAAIHCVVLNQLPEPL